MTMAYMSASAAASLSCHQHLPDPTRAFYGRTENIEAELAVSLLADRIVDPADDARNFEDLLGDLSGHDVPIVAFGDCDEGIRVLDTSLAQQLRVRAVADHEGAIELLAKGPARCRTAEGTRLPVDHGDLVAL